MALKDSYKEYAIRCYTCGTVLANKATDYEELLEQGLEIRDALDTVGLPRYCCRTNMMSPTIRYLIQQVDSVVAGGPSKILMPSDKTISRTIITDRDAETTTSGMIIVQEGVRTSIEVGRDAKGQPVYTNVLPVRRYQAR